MNYLPERPSRRSFYSTMVHFMERMCMFHQFGALVLAICVSGPLIFYFSLLAQVINKSKSKFQNKWARSKRHEANMNQAASVASLRKKPRWWDIINIFR